MWKRDEAAKPGAHTSAGPGTSTSNAGRTPAAAEAARPQPNTSVDTTAADWRRP